ncbi:MULTISPECIES: 2OG-Fe(II) oxygenase [unclassified Amycolatopsis]|uniref:2OG-Fe(II) oxygenase n=1 Tax=unclassified Amycolatopsis TaxID=2618356 RepID=UPI0028752544|nr:MULTISPECIES: 2OG-Fe(II) oxygenase [unclassified Amycolatopsis]MDS0139276.1 2OG-Fe(II) oxygenase [Amycolatopsis sp. 505]MDS0144508.1 2OG-Fe(II) oxygenase [Amycolatopsis sp. CM201R]
MINTGISLERFDKPFLHYLGEGLVSPEDISALNAVLPDREIYSREIKTGSEHRKEYRMWRSEVALESVRAPVADRLAPPWSKLVDSVLSSDFRHWLSENVKIDLAPCPQTVGLYVFEDGDYTTIDTGKEEKALTFALYLNEFWEEGFGGNYQLYSAKEPAASPDRQIVPIGGRCTTMTPGPSTWHRIQQVDSGGRADRLVMMLEFWRP